MGFNKTKFGFAKFDLDIFDGRNIPASPMVDDTTDAYNEDSWQVRFFGNRINGLKGKLFKR